MATTNMTNIRNQAERAGNAATRKVGEWADDAQGIASDVTRRAGDAYDTAREYAGEAYDYAADRMCNATKSAESFVKSHPLPTVLAALGVGILIGAVCWRD